MLNRKSMVAPKAPQPGVPIAEALRAPPGMFYEARAFALRVTGWRRFLCFT